VARRHHITGRVLVIHVVLCALIAGCSAQAPTAPGHVGTAAINSPSDALVSSPAETSASAPVQLRAARTSNTFQLLDGKFTLTLADGSTIWGTYHGTAAVPSAGQPRATLEGVVTGGTGRFAGATGGLSGTGTGGFAGDGDFLVALRATVSKGNGVSFELPVVLRGVSTSTCSTTAPPRMALNGTGSAKGVANATGHLEHNLGTQICAIIIE
jgi:hypothetical protein